MAVKKNTKYQLEGPMKGDLLSVDEAADYCNIRPTTIRAWILSKKLTYCKLGRRVLLRRSDLEALIERSVVTARGDR